MKNSKPPKPILKEIIARPEDIKPSSPDMKVVGVFNPGATTIQHEGKEKTVLMLRVAEVPAEEREDEVKLPNVPVDNNPNSEFKIEFDVYKKKDLLKIGKKEVSLPEGTNRLRHISYLVKVLSDDGINLDWNSAKIVLWPCYEHERFGIEDARITSMYGYYNITYTSPHRTLGVSTSIVQTKDFNEFQRLPIWNKPKSIFIGGKDVALFPERIPSPHSINEDNPMGDYAALTRPNAFSDISKPRIWLHYSAGENDRDSPHYLLYWGDAHLLVESKEGEYVGTGSPLVKTKDKWIGTYHEVYEEDNKKKYKTKLMALDIKEPWNIEKVITSDVLSRPNEFDIPEGYVPNVEYSSVLIAREKSGVADIYAGQNDSYTSMKRYYLEDLLKFSGIKA